MPGGPTCWTMLAGGATAIELGARASSRETVMLDEATDEAVLAIWHAQQAQAWTANIIGGFETALGRWARIVEDPPPTASHLLSRHHRLHPPHIRAGRGGRGRSG